jgi:hypothetical protein
MVLEINFFSEESKSKTKKIYSKKEKKTEFKKDED